MPTFVSRRVEVLGCRTMGADQQHMRLKLKQDNAEFDAVAFQLGDAVGQVSRYIDIVYNLEIDRWNGNVRPCA
jgi:single-stranded-DNA-specific exonuclease